jgi:DnaJ-class molecular chaperone
VASEQTDSADRTEESQGPRECMPCRGTGKLISNLGGAPTTVTCPWCDGGGVRVPGIDAQARWLENEPRANAETEDSAEPE